MLNLMYTNKAAMSQGTRDITYVEQMCLWRTLLGHYSNFKVMAEYNVELTPERVYNVIATMMYKFSVFATEVIPDKQFKIGYSLSLADKVRLNDVVEFIEDRTLDSAETILDRYHYEKFKFARGNALWRVKIINKKYALFFCDHILFDGTSGKNFHIEFSKCLGEHEPIAAGLFKGADSVVFDKTMVELGEFQLLPSPCAIINYNGPLLYNLYHILVELTPKCVSNWVRYYFSGNPYARILKYDYLQYKSYFIPDQKSECSVLNLEKHQTEALLKVARQHGVKFTSLLATLAHISIGRLIGDTDEDTKTTIPVNIRSMIDEEKAKQLCSNYSSAFGLYMSQVTFTLPCIRKLCPDNRINWELVTYINNHIHNDLQNAPFLLGLLRFVDLKQFVKENYENPDKYTLEISNLGMVPPALTNIGNMWFDQPSETFSINSISTAAGGANLALRCCNNKYVAGFKEHLESSIRELIEKEIGNG